MWGNELDLFPLEIASPPTLLAIADRTFLGPYGKPLALSNAKRETKPTLLLLKWGKIKIVRLLIYIGASFVPNLPLSGEKPYSISLRDKKGSLV